MNPTRSTLLFLSVFFFSPLLWAEGFTLVAGGGYKKPMQEVIQAYQKQSGVQLQASYGNMRQILSQAQASSQIKLVIGDQKFLQQSTAFKQFHRIGQGKLVIAWAQNRPEIRLPKDFANPELSRVAMPDPQKAIYGRAANEWIKSHDLTIRLKPILLQAATVPQVSAYLVAREIDAGFINLTDAIGLGDRIGGYQILENGYDPIQIVAAPVNDGENQSEVNAFLNFLQSDLGKTIFAKYGL